MAQETQDVGYQELAQDPTKACTNCKHFQPKEGDLGECFGNEVSSKASCNYFEPKEA